MINGAFSILWRQRESQPQARTVRDTTHRQRDGLSAGCDARAIAFLPYTKVEMVFDMLPGEEGHEASSLE
jgi:hypothetical protein